VTAVQKLTSLFVAIAFTVTTAGLAAGQATPAPPAEKKMEKAGEKVERAADKVEKKAEKADDKMTKKMTTKSASGTVKSASADTIVVGGKDKGKDAEWTFVLDPSTKVKRGGKDATPADLKPGDSVQVKYMDHDGKAVAQTVTARAGAVAKSGTAKPADKAK
jgi:Domain of unknown function (DUF5666)